MSHGQESHDPWLCHFMGRYLIGKIDVRAKGSRGDYIFQTGVNGTVFNTLVCSFIQGGLPTHYEKDMTKVLSP